ncbi:MAG: helix-turn-helix transcriptional regulator [Robiginitomaculum sp.]
MLSHQDIWVALDCLAQKFSMSPSGLARQAGLDPTAFNKSKRKTKDGKPRWLSTESLSKVLNTLGVSFEDFAYLAEKSQAKRYGLSMGISVPLIGMAQAGNDGFFDDAGYPEGEGWDDIRLPGLRDDNVYALQISGDSMAPVLRHGDRVVVAPNESIRRGDRIVVKTQAGEVMAKELKRLTAETIQLQSLNPEYPDRTIDLRDVVWMARIVWVTQ